MSNSLAYVSFCLTTPQIVAETSGIFDRRLICILKLSVKEHCELLPAVERQLRTLEDLSQKIKSLVCIIHNGVALANKIG